MVRSWANAILLTTSMLFFAMLLGGGVIATNKIIELYIHANQVRLDPYQLKYKDYSNGIDLSVHSKSLVVFFGDSRAEEWKPPLVAGIKFVNRGISYQTTAQVLGRIEQHVMNLPYDFVLLQVGINDLKLLPLLPLKKREIIRNVKNNIESTVNLLTASGRTVILTTIFPVGEVSFLRSFFWSNDVHIALSEVNEFIKTLESNHVTVFDAYKYLVGNDEKMQSTYAAGHLHLNISGYERLNIELVKLLGQ